MTNMSLARRLAGEGLGTFFLLAAVVGSGIMGESLSGGTMALALLGNTIATGAILSVLILMFGPVSGAHFNPAVTFAFWLRGDVGFGVALAYMAVQVGAGLLGVWAAHGMFDQPLWQASTHIRSGAGQTLSEFIAAFGLVAVILGCLRAAPQAVPYGVGLYISAGYWFTASTAFANPAVTLARAFTDTFSGIRLEDVPVFVVAQFIGAGLALWVFNWLWKGDMVRPK